MNSIEIKKVVAHGRKMLSFHTINLIKSQFHFLCSVRFVWIITGEKWCDFYVGLANECFFVYLISNP